MRQEVLKPWVARPWVGRSWIARPWIPRLLTWARAGILAILWTGGLAALAPPVLAVETGSVDSGNDAASDAYGEAGLLVESGDYAEALVAYRRLQRDFPFFERLPAVQTRIAVLLESRDAGPALTVFIDALERRDLGEVDQAIEQLDAVVVDFPESTLVDDALYLKAYFAVMNRYDFAAARETLLLLGRRFPDTAYRDSAVYLDAIALEQLGHTDAARTALATLRDQHTSLTLPFDFRWPAGGVLSRYWFDRADRRLDIIDRRLSDASTLRSSARQNDGKLRLDVNVGGIDMTLSLTPSALVRETAWRDAGLADRAPPPVGVYEGTVLGHADSWVRAVVREKSITGLVEIGGERHRLLPANLVGTLDYYQPKPDPVVGLDDTTSLAEILRDSDALEPPPSLGGAREAVNPNEPALGAAHSDVRAIPLSIVIDSQYDRYHAGDGLAAALNDLNVADGIYRSFGLALSLDEVLTFEATRDPMDIGPVTLETLLRRFREYRLSQSTLFESSALTYLFSGNPKTDVTLGLAWIDTLCRTDGYDVGVTTPSEFGDVLLTHELGHSLGAQHDSDTACSANAEYLMWPNISSRTPTTLSPCSEASVRQSHARSCLLDTVDLSLSIVDEGDTVRFVARNTDASLSVDATLFIETGDVHREAWPTSCQVTTPTSARCEVDALLPGERRNVRMAALSGAQLAATLLPDGVAELTPDDNRAVTEGLIMASAPDGLGFITVVGTEKDSKVEAASSQSDTAGPEIGGSRSGGAGSASPWVWLALLSGAGRWRDRGAHPG